MTGPAQTSDFRIVDDGSCLHFVLTRPHKANAINGDILAGLDRCLARASDGDLRALIISGEGGRFFSAGADLAEAQAMSLDENLDRCAMVRDLFSRLNRCHIFSIAVIDGLALGGGLELAMACSIRVASTTAGFGMPEVSLGLMPAFGGTCMLPSLVGRGRALEMMLTGDRIDAAHALVCGLIDYVEADGTAAMAKAQAIADRVTARDARAVAAILDCLQSCDETGTVDALAREGMAQGRLLKERDALYDAARRE